jgi:flagellar biosynthetic protein FlhB
MADDAQDRQLPATERKIEKARREGQVARSRDLGHFAALGLGVALLGLAAPALSQWLADLVGNGLRFDARGLAHPEGMTEHLAAQVLQMVLVLVPLGALFALLALAAGLLSGGWNFSFEALEPKFEKIDPFAGVKRLFSGENLTQTLKSCLLALVLGITAGVYLHLHWPDMLALGLRPLPVALAEGGGMLQGGLLLLGGVLALFALVDVPLQRHMLLKRLRMSVEEVKKEMKDVEGNAEVKGKQKLRMREMANRRMFAAVPKADLVVMNPTHYAVALKYEQSGSGAPRVVAKGADLVALRIRDLAQEHKVPVLQAPALARALYAHCELEQEIPTRLFGVVAQVLAWVFQLRDAVARGQRLDLPPPPVVVPADMDPADPAFRRDRAGRAGASGDTGGGGTDRTPDSGAGT